MPTYPPEVEKWRTLATRILREVGGPQFNPEDVDKLLHVIRFESGGNSKAAGDNGASIGLTQLNSNGLGSGMTVAQREDPETNIRVAAQAIYGGSGWAPWGEGNLYQGKPFGSLGNHPYVTSEVLGKVITNEEPTVTNEEPIVSKDNYLRTIVKGIKGAHKDLQKKYLPEPQIYSPTGDFNTDASGYWSLAQNAWAQIDRLQQSSVHPLLVDEDQELVIDQVTGQVNIEATRLLKVALSNEDNLERLYAAKQAGLMDSGESAAAAYLTSEKEKVAEATRKYEDYVKRVKDLVAFEDMPITRQQNLANMLSAVNTANAKRTKLDPYMQPKGGPQFTDTSPFAKAIGATIPSEAPAPYNINPEALAPQPTASLSLRPPEEVLASFGVPSPVNLSGLALPSGLTGGMSSVVPNAPMVAPAAINLSSGTINTNPNVIIPPPKGGLAFKRAAIQAASTPHPQPNIRR